MSDLSEAIAPIIPPHVAPELVREFAFEEMTGADTNPVQAAADVARDADTPPIFFGTRARRGGGAWVVTTHELNREILQDAARFSSKGNAGFSALFGETWDLLPLEVDPPEHGIWRLLMNPIFSPNRINAIDSDIRATARSLVDKVLAKGESDFVPDFAEPFPVSVFLSLLGLPLEDAPMLLGYENGLIHSTDLAVKAASAKGIRDYLVEKIADRRANPGDDLISYVVGAKVEGRSVTDQEALAVCYLMYLAGLDTVTAQLGFIFKHLAEHPEDQQRLREDRSLLPNAIEEFLRAYPIVVSGRIVTKDLVFHGVDMRAGDVVALGMMFAGRDGGEFADADTVNFDRENVSHISFAAGPHRCLGSHLARREIRIALEEWLDRVPPFRVAPGKKAVTHALGVFGVHTLPLAW